MQKKMLELNIMISDVESDDARNMEKAKKSRHSRNVSDKILQETFRNNENFESPRGHYIKAKARHSKNPDPNEDDTTEKIVSDEEFSSGSEKETGKYSQESEESSTQTMRLK